MKTFLSKRPATASLATRVIFRQLRKEELQDLEWEGEYTHFKRLYRDTYERTRRGTAIMWVAELPGTGIIAQVFIQLDCSRPELADGKVRAYLYSFRVRSAFRSQGLGTYILERVEEDLVKRGYSYLTLNVAKDNKRALKLYQKCGYRVVAHEPGIWDYIDDKGYWQHVDEPAWRMEKKIR
jgi:ribosomal protein S18 acetylase RimI-like enzyme